MVTKMLETLGVLLDKPESARRQKASEAPGMVVYICNPSIWEVETEERGI